MTDALCSCAVLLFSEQLQKGLLSLGTQGRGTAESRGQARLTPELSCFPLQVKVSLGKSDGRLGCEAIQGGRRKLAFSPPQISHHLHQSICG